MCYSYAFDIMHLCNASINTRTILFSFDIFLFNVKIVRPLQKHRRRGVITMLVVYSLFSMFLVLYVVSCMILMQKVGIHEI